MAAGNEVDMPVSSIPRLLDMPTVTVGCQAHLWRRNSEYENAQVTASACLVVQRPASFLVPITIFDPLMHYSYTLTPAESMCFRLRRAVPGYDIQPHYVAFAESKGMQMVYLNLPSVVVADAIVRMFPPSTSRMIHSNLNCIYAKKSPNISRLGMRYARNSLDSRELVTPQLPDIVMGRGPKHFLDTYVSCPSVMMSYPLCTYCKNAYHAICLGKDPMDPNGLPVRIHYCRVCDIVCSAPLPIETFVV